jgi:hypothetical protein
MHRATVVLRWFREAVVNSTAVTCHEGTYMMPDDALTDLYY